MKHSLYISFQIKRSKINRKGLVPVYMRITVDGQRVELSMNRQVNPSSWDDVIGKVSGRSEVATILNNYLDGMRNKVRREFNILESLDNEITARNLKNILLGKSDKRLTLIELFNQHNEDLKQRIGIDYAEGTYKHYQSSLKRIKQFLEHECSQEDVLIGSVNYSFITRYESYLKRVHKSSHNTTVKAIKRLKKVINVALANEWLEKDPFINYKCSYKQSERGFLSDSELKKLEEKIITLPRLEKVRDIFIFCCYTGLAWSDVTALTTENIARNINGNNCLIFYRNKTGTRCSVPLLSQAQLIIDKYKEDPESNEKGCLLPVNSNQRMNGYLKEIAEICGITKKLTMHLARHTFATTVTLSNGVPIETVSKMLGHTSIKTTQIYSKVVDTKISEDMKALKDKMYPSRAIKTVNE